MAEKRNIQGIVNLVFKAVALAMGVAVVVLSILRVATVETSILMLGIGLFCLAITELDR
jgi:hypothetical protein